MITEPSADQPVWMDGTFVPWREARMHVTDHHFGVGVFEGVRAYAVEGGSAIFRLEDHTARLFRSARMLNIALAERHTEGQLSAIQVELLKKSPFRDAYLRPFIFYGGAMGLAPTTRGLTIHAAVIALEWRGGSDASAGKKRSVTLRTTAFARQRSASTLHKAKANANYITGMLAQQDAHASGADDALLLDQDGYVTETTGANLFVVRDGRVQTPPCESILEGVTRATVFELVRRTGWDVTERRLARDDVYTADEVFLTGTAVEITAVREVDGRRIGSGEAGPLTERLQKSYAALVRGRAEHSEEWLTRI